MSAAGVTVEFVKERLIQPGAPRIRTRYSSAQMIGVVAQLERRAEGIAKAGLARVQGPEARNLG
jgi:hypothetical protein